jgi:transcription initiation factor IIE alpha subunit
MRIGPPIRVPKAYCTACLNALTRVASFDDVAMPRGGDLFICSRCGNLMVYQDDLSLRTMTADEFSRLPTQRQNQIKAVRQTIAGHE